MISKYHTRASYEAQLKRLSVECDGTGVNMVNVRKMTDYQLLRMINHELKRLGCIQMTADELECELH
jgi:hypothetical protein